MSTPLYVHGSNAGSREGVFDAIRAALVAAGWTELFYSPTVGLRYIYSQGSELTPGVGNAPIIGVGELVADSTIYFWTCADYEPGSHTMIEVAGNVQDHFANNAIHTGTTSNQWWLRINPFAMFVSNMVDGGNVWNAYDGLLKRGLGAAKSGVTTTTAAYTAGATVLAVSSDMTAQLQVGQKIHIQNFHHVAASANVGHCEVKTISAIASGSITLSAGLSLNYDAGALVGEMPLPTACGGNSTTGFPSVFVPFNKDGSRSSSTGQTYSEVLYPLFCIGQSEWTPDGTTGEFASGPLVLLSSMGFGGYPYNVLIVAGSAGSYGDIYSDGDNQFALAGAHAGGPTGWIYVVTGPNATGTPTHQMAQYPGVAVMDQDNNAAQVVTNITYVAQPVLTPNFTGPGPGTPDFGTDFQFLAGLNPSLSLTSGVATLGQDIAHRLMTPRGGLFYDPDYGTDLRVYLNAPMTSQTLGALVNDATSECLKDERVQTCVVTPAFDAASSTLNLGFSCLTADGPFTFIISVTKASVALLSQPAAS